jgi:hypothetical protein
MNVGEAYRRHFLLRRVKERQSAVALRKGGKHTRARETTSGNRQTLNVDGKRHTISMSRAARCVRVCSLERQSHSGNKS